MSPLWFKLRSRLSRVWLVLFATDAERIPNWIQKALDEDEALQQFWAQDQQLESQLRSESQSWLAQSETREDESLNVKLTNPALSQHPTGVNLRPWLASAAVLCLVGFGISLVRLSNANPGGQGPSLAQDVSQEPEYDLRPLLASAEASQKVYLQVASATQDYMQEGMRPLSTEFVSARSTELDQAVDRVGNRVAQRFTRVLALLQPSKERAGDSIE